MAAALGGQPRHSVTPAASAPALPGGQFIGRLLQHVLPLGFKRIRHYGLLAPAAKTARLASAHKLLAMPAANAQAREDAQTSCDAWRASRSIPARIAGKAVGA